LAQVQARQPVQARAVEYVRGVVEQAEAATKAA
jgi:hypothetical protein